MITVEPKDCDGAGSRGDEYGSSWGDDSSGGGDDDSIHGGRRPQPRRPRKKCCRRRRIGVTAAAAAATVLLLIPRSSIASVSSAEGARGGPSLSSEEKPPASPLHEEALDVDVGASGPLGEDDLAVGGEEGAIPLAAAKAAAAHVTVPDDVPHDEPLDDDGGGGEGDYDDDPSRRSPPPDRGRTKLGGADEDAEESSGEGTHGRSDDGEAGLSQSGVDGAARDSVSCADRSTDSHQLGEVAGDVGTATPGGDEPVSGGPSKHEPDVDGGDDDDSSMEGNAENDATGGANVHEARESVGPADVDEADMDIVVVTSTGDDATAVRGTVTRPVVPGEDEDGNVDEENTEGKRIPSVAEDSIEIEVGSDGDSIEEVEVGPDGGDATGIDAKDPDGNDERESSSAVSDGGGEERESREGDFGGEHRTAAQEDGDTGPDLVHGEDPTPATEPAKAKADRDDGNDEADDDYSRSNDAASRNEVDPDPASLSTNPADSGKEGGQVAVSPSTASGDEILEGDGDPETKVSTHADVMEVGEDTGEGGDDGAGRSAATDPEGGDGGDERSDGDDVEGTQKLGRDVRDTTKDEDRIDGDDDVEGTESDGHDDEEEDDDDDDGPIQKSVNYAHKSAGAIILANSPAFKGTSNLLVSDNDRYAIAPCAEKKSVTVGLSEDILVKRVVISNYEKYSGSVREFQIMGSQDYEQASSAPSPTPSSASHSSTTSEQHRKNSKYQWHDLGVYEASPRPGEQAFNLTEPSWARYLKFRFLTHHGVEHYCTITQIKVHGSTMLQGFHEQYWQSEEEAAEAEAEHGVTDAEEKVDESGIGQGDHSRVDVGIKASEAEGNVDAYSEATAAATAATSANVHDDRAEGGAARSESGSGRAETKSENKAGCGGARADCGAAEDDENAAAAAGSSMHRGEKADSSSVNAAGGTHGADVALDYRDDLSGKFDGLAETADASSPNDRIVSSKTVPTSPRGEKGVSDDDSSTGAVEHTGEEEAAESEVSQEDAANDLPPPRPDEGPSRRGESVTSRPQQSSLHDEGGESKVNRAKQNSEELDEGDSRVNSKTATSSETKDVLTHSPDDGGTVSPDPRWRRPESEEGNSTTTSSSSNEGEVSGGPSTTTSPEVGRSSSTKGCDDGGGLEMARGQNKTDNNIEEEEEEEEESGNCVSSSAGVDSRVDRDFAETDGEAGEVDTESAEDASQSYSEGATNAAEAVHEGAHEGAGSPTPGVVLTDAVKMITTIIKEKIVPSSSSSAGAVGDGDASSSGQNADALNSDAKNSVREDSKGCANCNVGDHSTSNKKSARLGSGSVVSEDVRASLADGSLVADSASGGEEAAADRIASVDKGNESGRHSDQQKKTTSSGSYMDDATNGGSHAMGDKDASRSTKMTASSDAKSYDEDGRRNQQDQVSGAASLERQAINDSTSSQQAKENPVKSLQDDDSQPFDPDVLAQKYPYMDCLEHLNFDDFRSRVLARGAASKTTSKPNPPEAPLKMEPIFKTLTDEIRALQTSLSIYDQYVKASSACYRSIVMQMARENQRLQMTQNERIASIEREIIAMRELRAAVTSATDARYARYLDAAHSALKMLLRTIDAHVLPEVDRILTRMQSLLHHPPLMVGFILLSFVVVFIFTLIRRRKEKCDKAPVTSKTTVVPSLIDDDGFSTPPHRSASENLKNTHGDETDTDMSTARDHLHDGSSTSSSIEDSSECSTEPIRLLDR